MSGSGRTGLCVDARFRAHVAPPGHPECPERLLAIERALDEADLLSRCVPVAAREATRAELLRVHTPRYLDALEQTVRNATEPGYLDADTYFSSGTWQAALLAAGATIDCALRVLRGDLQNAFAAVRPPGHHATADRAMGFCLLNNVAVAAAAAKSEGARVAIVDFDVHHGNGTEEIFADDADVFYASTHEWPLYPGTGAAAFVGGPRARGTTLNVPLPAGTGDEEWLAAYRETIFPALRRFRPDLLLVSAGFDAHRRDPLASLEVTERGYAALVRELGEFADGRVALALEGGYDLAALARSVVRVVAVLLGGVATVPDSDAQ